MNGPDWRVIRHRSGARRLLIALVVLVVAGLGTAGAVAFAGSDDERRPGDGLAAPSTGVPAEPSASGPLVIEAVPVPEPVQLPPPTQVRIAAIGVDSPLETLGVDAAGALQVPVDFAKAGWYSGGVPPGDQGPAVIAGHVDSERGPAVFYRLRDLKAGDIVEVARGEQWVRFRVIASERYPKNRFPTDRVYQPTPVPELRLITCGGSFDRGRRSYEDNIVVYAVPE